MNTHTHTHTHTSQFYLLCFRFSFRMTCDNICFYLTLVFINLLCTWYSWCTVCLWTWCRNYMIIKLRKCYSLFIYSFIHMMLQKIVNERINKQRNDDYFASYIDNSKRARSRINGAVITDMAATAAYPMHANKSDVLLITITHQHERIHAQIYWPRTKHTPLVPIFQAIDMTTVSTALAPVHGSGLSTGADI